MTVNRAADPIQEFHIGAKPVSKVYLGAEKIWPLYVGSTVFDGALSYLEVNGSGQLAFGLSDFTVECWIKGPPAGNEVIFDFRPPGVNGPYLSIGLDATGALSIWFMGVNALTGTNAPIKDNTWHHLAVARSAGITRCFRDGKNIGQVADTTSYQCGANRPQIGFNGFLPNPSDPRSGIFTGSISNLRMVNGKGLYVTDFVPPEAPLSIIPGTALLMCNDAAGITDVSPQKFAITQHGTTAAVVDSPY